MTSRATSPSLRQRRRSPSPMLFTSPSQMTSPRPVLKQQQLQSSPTLHPSHMKSVSHQSSPSPPLWRLVCYWFQLTDVVAQRQFLFFFFLFSQVVKFYVTRLGVISSSDPMMNYSSLVKERILLGGVCCWDALVVWSIRWTQVPRLRWRRRAVWTLILLLCLVNAFMLASPVLEGLSLLLGKGMKPVLKQSSDTLATTASSPVHRVLGNEKKNLSSASLQGSHVISLVPLPTLDATLISTSACYLNSSSSVQWTLTLTGTAPWTVQYQREFEDEKSSADVEVKSSPFILTLTRPGLYTIVSFRDSHSSPPLSHPSPAFYYPECPRVRTMQFVKHACVKESIQWKGWIQSMHFPVQLSLQVYRLTSNDASQETTLMMKETQRIDALPAPHSRGWFSSSSVEDVTRPWLKEWDNAELEQARKRNEAPVQWTLTGFHTPGTYVLKWFPIQDAKQYQGLMMEETLTLHAQPNAHFLQKSVTIKRDDVIPLKVQCFGSAPFQLTLEQTLTHQRETVTVSTTDPVILRTLWKHAGTYQLVSIQDGLCSLPVMLNSSSPIASTALQVQEWPLPRVEMNASPVQSTSGSCSGSSGLKMNILFHGKAPFRVMIEERFTVNNTTTNKSIIALTSSSYEMTHYFTPKHPGHYTFELVSCTDQNYENIPISQQSTSLIVHPIPSGDLKCSSSLICAGQALDCRLQVYGTFPMKVVLKLIQHSDSYATDNLDKQYQWMNWTLTSSTEHVFQVMPWQGKSGDYQLEWVSLVDGRECEKTSLKRIDFTVQSEKLPDFSVEQEETHAKVGQSVSLKLQFIGQPPFQLSWQEFHSQSLFNRTQSFTQSEARLVLSPSVTQLQSISLKDAHHCVSQKTLPPMTWERFSLPVVKQIVPLFDQNVCLNGNHSMPIKVSVKGVLPITFNVMHILPSGKEERMTLDWTHSNNGNNQENQEIDMEKIVQLSSSNEVGLHQFHFQSMSDFHYNSIPLDKKSLTLIQRFIHPLPLVTLVQEHEFICKTSKTFITIKVSQGECPCHVRYRLEWRDNDVFVPLQESVARVLSAEAVQIPLDIGTRIGKVRVRLLSIQDKWGCERNMTDQWKEWHVMEAPHVQLLNAPKEFHACVGQPFTFTFGGSGPFHFQYAFKESLSGKESVFNETLFHPDLTLTSQSAGEIRLLSLCNNYCCVPVSDMPWTRTLIHALPSAHLLTQNSLLLEGESAELTVTLRGTPPLSFTLQKQWHDRYFESEDIHLMSETVWKRKVFEQGVFRVVAVWDKYCRTSTVAIKEK